MTQIEDFEASEIGDRVRDWAVEVGEATEGKCLEEREEADGWRDLAGEPIVLEDGKVSCTAVGITADTVPAAA